MTAMICACPLSHSKSPQKIDFQFAMDTNRRFVYAYSLILAVDVECNEMLAHRRKREMSARVWYVGIMCVIQIFRIACINWSYLKCLLIPLNCWIFARYNHPEWALTLCMPHLTYVCLVPCGVVCVCMQNAFARVFVHQFAKKHAKCAPEKTGGAIEKDRWREKVGERDRERVGIYEWQLIQRRDSRTHFLRISEQNKWMNTA